MSVGADRSLCPNAQTKTHVSMSLQSHFAARGHYTTPCPSHRVCAAKRVPMTRPVTPVHPTGAMPANCEATCGHGTVGMQGPDAHAGAVQEWDATPAAMFARAGVQRRPALACSPRASGSYTGAGIQRTQQSLSNGQHPGHHHPPACPRTAHWRGCGGCGCPQGVCAYQGGATWGAAARILLR